MSYRIAPVGVIEIATGELLTLSHPRWAIYSMWLADGNSPLPMIVNTPAPTQAELDAIAEQAARKAMRDALQVDATVTFLRRHTPTEAAAWVQTNVTDLASAKNVLVKLAMIVSYLARERLVPDPVPPTANPLP